MPDNQILTHESFQTLLGWLDVNVESAGEKYETIRRRLIRLFVGRGCPEAELLADRTIDRVSSRIPQIRETYVGEPAAYFCGVANNIHHEWLRGQEQEREAALIDLTSEPQDDAEFECLQRCLEKLSNGSRELILEYYRGEKRAKIKRRRDLATRLDITIGALQIKASRIRTRLTRCVGHCVERKK